MLCKVWENTHLGVSAWRPQKCNRKLVLQTQSALLINEKLILFSHHHQVLSHNLCTVMKIPHDPVALEEHFKDDDEGPVSNQGYMPYLNKFILDKVSQHSLPPDDPHCVDVFVYMSPHVCVGCHDQGTVAVWMGHIQCNWTLHKLEIQGLHSTLTGYTDWETPRISPY